MELINLVIVCKVYPRAESTATSALRSCMEKMVFFILMANHAYLKSFQVQVFEVGWGEFFEKIKVVINCVTRLYCVKLDSLEAQTMYGASKCLKFGFEGF